MPDNILIVDDDPGTIRLMARILKGVGHLRFATRGAEALHCMSECVPDLVLLDAEMPMMSGFDTCAAMKADPALRDVPVIFVTAHGDEALELRCFELGAADFITKPVRESRLLARVKTQLRVRQLTAQLRRLSTTDALTGIANRRRFDEVMGSAWSRCLRGEPVTLVLLDVDHFKLYNDHYGHPAGDACLCLVAEALTHACDRSRDLVARFGGEEFSVILPHTPREEARAVTQRLLDAVADVRIPHAAPFAGPIVTVSAGAASFDQSSPCWSTGHMSVRTDPARAVTEAELLIAADRALYAAKQHGRARAYYLDVADFDRPDRATALAVSPAANLPCVA
ncbi:MAG: diguanylate cyclase [bacterium]